MSISGKAKLAGIIGWPVTHSLSPVLHGHWLAEYGIDGAMVPLAAQREDFAAVIDGARRAGFNGVNVTVPHKEAAFAIAHQVDDAANAAGAANLLVFHGREIEARNTAVEKLKSAALDRARHMLRMGFVVYEIREPSGSLFLDEAAIHKQLGASTPAS